MITIYGKPGIEIGSIIGFILCLLLFVLAGQWHIFPGDALIGIKRQRGFQKLVAIHLHDRQSKPRKQLTTATDEELWITPYFNCIPNLKSCSH
jgi:hypothetical protein